MKRTTNYADVSIVPVGQEPKQVSVGDALPVIWWSNPRGGVDRKTRIGQKRDLTKAVDSVRRYVKTLEATVGELKQLVSITF